MQPRKSSARVGLTLDAMRMSMGCISGTQLLLMEGQDRMSNRVAGAQRMMEQVVEYKRRSGELTSTRSLTDRLPPQVQGQEEIEHLATPRAYHVDEGLRRSESGNVTAESRFEGVCEPFVCGRVNIASLRSETKQVRGPLRASLKVSHSNPLRCLKNYSYRYHYQSVIRSPRYFSNYLGDFFRISNVPWCFSPLVQCNEQSFRRSEGSSTELRYFLPS